MKKKDRYYTLHEITGMIIECAKPGKFTVKEIQPSDVYDFKNCIYMNLQINPDLRKQSLPFQPCIILSMIHKSEDISLPTNRSMDWFTTRSKWPWSISESILSSCLKT
uniref:Uncharacterized protein n=1 Tax=Cacopsylla melanoneura TaxID=428564 RepID=A0A8D8YVC5_9HEMI